MPHLRNSTIKPNMLKKILIALISVITATNSFAQKPKKTGKYPSVLWEITGNGLSKPSYLFGTMHVSSKMVFHLSDSFYYALENVDMVALELNPVYWQRDMVKMDAAQESYNDFYKDDTYNYITENSFRIKDYTDDFKTALSTNPQQINSLLYRTYSEAQDYEEDTYLDLYIYQTGRKFGKAATGVEDYYETQRKIMEAYAAQMKEKNKKNPDTDGQSAYDIQKKTQDAYRRGDLDLLDSLQRLSFSSAAFTEKFLYDRNIIQANSIDTILKKHSLFVGVGAAHLPGQKGVIELLRKKGYTLRPVLMQDRDAAKKDEVDKLKVPVNFIDYTTPDGVISMQTPGALYQMQEANYSMYSGKLSSSNVNMQYADMENGAYYMLTRVHTNAPILGQSAEVVKEKADSLLYENIPGKIIAKKDIEKDGYPGFDITNRTRRGDLQRYNIIITPYEILVFKMSGNEDYVAGSEADTFFNSIKIKNEAPLTGNYVSDFAGFHAKFSEQPFTSFHKSAADGNSLWQFEANDKATGNAYSVWKKTILNFDFIEEDTFDLSLIEESLKGSDFIDKETSRQFTTADGYNALRMQFALKESGYLNAEAILRGQHYYLLTQRSEKKLKSWDDFFTSFGFNNYNYGNASVYTDSLLSFTVQTPVAPSLDTALMQMIKDVMKDETIMQQVNGVSSSYWPKDEYACFRSDSTGETVLVSRFEYPKYYYTKDSSTYWKRIFNIEDEDDLAFRGKEKFVKSDSCSGYKVSWADTNSVRKMDYYKMLYNNRLYGIYVMSDTLSQPSSFVKTFLETFQPLPNNGPSVFKSKLDTFFTDLYSKDSLTKAKARNAIGNVYYKGEDGLNRVTSFINNLKYGEDDYFELKSKFIGELGYIDDSCCTDKVVDALQNIYKKTADTAYFQNEVFYALENLKTKKSYEVLKEMLLQEPPVFDNDGEYSDFISAMSDSLQLGRSMFPELLQLTNIPEYKEPVNELLIDLLDSGMITANDYASYYNKIYFDARIEMKRQQITEEKLLEKQTEKENGNADEEETNAYDYSRYSRYGNYGSSSEIENYAILLMPFYKTEPALEKFYTKLLQSRDTSLQLEAATQLIKNKLPVADSILVNMAKQDKYCSQLLDNLEDIKRTDLFPAAYKKQVDIARSILNNDAYSASDKPVETEPAGSTFVNIHGQKGYVYFFRYKTKDDEDWQMGLSGIQPENKNEVSGNSDFTTLTDKKITDEKPEAEQFNEQLKKLLIKEHRSGKNFYGNDYDYNYDYDDEN